MSNCETFKELSVVITGSNYAWPDFIYLRHYSSVINHQLLLSNSTRIIFSEFLSFCILIRFANSRKVSLEEIRVRVILELEFSLVWNISVLGNDNQTLGLNCIRWNPTSSIDVVLVTHLSSCTWFSRSKHRFSFSSFIITSTVVNLSYIVIFTQS